MKHKRLLPLILAVAVSFAALFSFTSCASVDGVTDSLEDSLISYWEELVDSFSSPRVDDIYVNEDGYLVVNGTQTEYKVEGGTTYCTHGKADKTKENVVEPTCTENGIYDEVCCCLACNEVWTNYVTIPALGHNYVDGFCTECGQEIQYTRDGDYIYFGEYPQTIKSSDVTISSTQDARGYYLGSDGEYYAKVVANPYSSGYKFSNNSTVYSSTTYYFKVEPIRWRILSVEGSNALILCDSIIASMAYDAGYDNNYANSDIRAWLNATFYETAFSELQREIILTTTVDNSVYSTGYDSNPYACEDTEDKLFLLSYSEVMNSAYGFEGSSSYDEARRMETTDYTRATGAYMSTDGSYYGNGYWWLRSPNNNNSSNSRYVNSIGYAYGNDYVSDALGGVMPVLWIRL